MKNWQFRLVSVAAALFFVLYFQVVLQYGVDKTLLDKTVAVLTFIGVAAAVMAAVPVMTSIFSYKDFKQNFNEANEKLNTLNLEHKNLRNKVDGFLERLGKKEQELDKSLEEYNKKNKGFSLLYRYVLNEHIEENEKEWIDLYIDIKNIDMGYRLFSILAKFKQDEQALYEEDAILGKGTFNEELIELWLKALPYYKILAEFEPKARQEYCNHIRYILNQYVRGNEVNNELNERVKQLVLDLIKEDEFDKFNCDWNDEFKKSLTNANKKLKINSIDLENYRLINQYNYRKDRLSNLFKKH